MTTEEAIRYWQKFRRETEQMDTDCYWPRREKVKQLEATDMAIAALSSQKKAEGIV